jgi:hypothetical protein
MAAPALKTSSPFDSFLRHNAEDYYADIISFPKAEHNLTLHTPMLLNQAASPRIEMFEKSRFMVFANNVFDRYQYSGAVNPKLFLDDDSGSRALDVIAMSINIVSQAGLKSLELTIQSSNPRAGNKILQEKLTLNDKSHTLFSWESFSQEGSELLRHTCYGWKEVGASTAADSTSGIAGFFCFRSKISS